jgi:hypothetical protein
MTFYPTTGFHCSGGQERRHAKDTQDLDKNNKEGNKTSKK